MNDPDFDRWYARYGDTYDTLDEARADFDRYLTERALFAAIFAGDNA